MRRITKREVRDFIARAMGEVEISSLPEGCEQAEFDTHGDSLILLTVNGQEFRVIVSIPRALHGRGGPKKRAVVTQDAPK